ncbi:sulfocyanin-like copper-binding protein [Demequina lutea]|uniref:Putative cupredoxin-like copper-binding protein n=1 Tax=Demequina lutea TaxID=431489 RepID=A0A7Y9ZAP1_9MICO|nr:sulfocyanin-like copper-binding protein [Demequina lutea]NYI41315.1 putative cupredoxin-like copper-binding protein [Demequina lutea]
MSGLTRGWTIAALVAAMAVLAVSAVATFNLAGRGQDSPGWLGNDRAVTAPRGPSAQNAGTVVDVVAMDMAGGRMMGSQRGMMGGAMALRSDRVDVPAGTVTLRLYNEGTITHELVVLPLADGQQVGERSVGADGRVSESGSLGEASKSGGEGAGDGIEPGTTGWVTLNLPAGRYEIVCNIEGHYAAGMYTLLVVN